MNGFSFMQAFVRLPTGCRTGAGRDGRRAGGVKSSALRRRAAARSSPKLGAPVRMPAWRRPRDMAAGACEGGG